MFCPKCATQNAEGSSFCRSCGANISLIPQALTGNLPTEPAEACADFGWKRQGRLRGEPSIDTAIQGIVMGVAFAVVAFLVARFAPAGSIWWFWLLIPSAGCFGKGLAALMRLKASREKAAFQPAPPQATLNSLRTPAAPASRTGELMPSVPSVTEGTTRHLGADAQTRHFDSH